MSKEANEVKDKIIQTMVTEQTLYELQQEATVLGLTMSAYVRTLILAREETAIHTFISTQSNKGVTK